MRFLWQFNDSVRYYGVSHVKYGTRYFYLVSLICIIDSD